MAKLTTEQVNQMIGLQQDKIFDISPEDLQKTSSTSALIKMLEDIKKYNDMLMQKITFINKTLTDVIPFTRENLYLVCSYSGCGKSTTASNITYPLWQEKKKILVISNEERKHDIYMRIACLHQGLNFNSYKKGNMNGNDQLALTSLFPSIAQYVHVIDIDDNNGASSKLEGILEIFEAARNGDYSCILLDYYQNITGSVENPSRSKFDILNQFRSYLMRYIQTTPIPVVVFAQLHSVGKRNNKELDSRIKDAPTIYEAATVVIEIVADFKKYISNFLIKKDRFGYSGGRVELAFDRGRYVELTDEFKKNMINKQVNDISAKISGKSTEVVSGFYRDADDFEEEFLKAGDKKKR